MFVETFYSRTTKEDIEDFCLRKRLNSDIIIKMADQILHSASEEGLHKDGLSNKVASRSTKAIQYRKLRQEMYNKSLEYILSSNVTEMDKFKSRSSNLTEKIRSVIAFRGPVNASYSNNIPLYLKPIYSENSRNTISQDFLKKLRKTAIIELLKDIKLRKQNAKNAFIKKRND